MREREKFFKKYLFRIEGSYVFFVYSFLEGDLETDNKIIRS